MNFVESMDTMRVELEDGTLVDVAVMGDGKPCEWVERCGVRGPDWQEVRISRYRRGAGGVYRFEGERVALLEV